MTPEDLEIYDKLIQEKLKTIDGFISFEGQNCHDLDDNECEGWDGYSRRCQCSNRRVSWTLSSCKTYVYGEAY